MSAPPPLKAALRIWTDLEGSTYFLLVPSIRAKRDRSSDMNTRFLCTCVEDDGERKIRREDERKKGWIAKNGIV